MLHLRQTSHAVLPSPRPCLVKRAWLARFLLSPSLAANREYPPPGPPPGFLRPAVEALATLASRPESLLGRLARRRYPAPLGRCLPFWPQSLASNLRVFRLLRAHLVTIWSVRGFAANLEYCLPALVSPLAPALAREQIPLGCSNQLAPYLLTNREFRQAAPQCLLLQVHHTRKATALL